MADNMRALNNVPIMAMNKKTEKKAKVEDLSDLTVGFHGPHIDY